MDIYEYDKSFLDRLEESMIVLSLKENCVASEIKSLWSSWVDLVIEPGDWQTLWKVPRVICEELNIRFPLIVFGRVEHVNSEDLKATFLVEAVQDDDVHLPERHDVSLIDLYPTIIQENNALDVEKTADCLDRLRFFMCNVFYPWDQDSDLNWHERRLEQRIRFCYDLRSRNMDAALATHIRNLLNEAKYLQQRREYLELNDNDDFSDSEDSPVLGKDQITELVRIHFRLNIIRGEIEILENPEMRRVYEEGNLGGIVDPQTKTISNYAILLPVCTQKHMKLLKALDGFVSDEEVLCVSHNFQDTLNAACPKAKLYLSPGVHHIKGYGYRNNDGMIAGIIENNLTTKSDDLNGTKIASLADEEILMGFDGDYTLKNLTLVCSNVQTGLLIRAGHVRLYNCRLLGDTKSSTKRGIVCSKNASLTMENCVLQGFGSTLILHDNTKVHLDRVSIKNCHIGIDLIGSKSVHMHFENSQIINAGLCGFYATGLVLEDTNAKSLILSSIDEVSAYTNVSGSVKFAGCKTNVCVLNRSHSITSKNTMKVLYVDDGDRDDDAEESETSMLIDVSPHKTNGSKRHCVSQTIELNDCSN